MSAITGIFMRNGKDVDPELMKKMNNKLGHRGPDGSSTWCQGSVGLGHQMLWTTPESLHEKLPLEEDGLIITADARIDNRTELSEKLGIRDEEDVADSYFILKAYAKWGEDCPDKLLGDFAFAIWDKAQKKLFCARDHMGVKPFYYYLDDDIFVFGTEIKALFCVDGVPYELNERKITFYLMKDTLDNENTFYKNVKSLPSANSLTLDDNNIKKIIYWKLDPNLKTILKSEEDYVKIFLEIFTEAVNCRLRSYLPIGAELSGGLDSSSIVCMAQKILSENNDSKTINTFSRVFDETPESDERYYIKKVINKNGIKSHFIKADNISPLENIKSILWHQDQPFYTPHITKQIRTYEKIKCNEIKILLCGEGGDQIVSHGNNYLRELAIKFKWRKLIKEIKGRSNVLNQPKLKIILNKIIFPSMPYYLKKGAKSFLIREKRTLVFNKKFLSDMGINEREYRKNLNSMEKISSKEYHYKSINSGLNETIFGTIDRRTANFNIEVRYPFYDKRLVEFCYSIPTQMKLKFGWGRYILRLSMENILPTEIQWRKDKTNLGPTFEKDLLLEKSTLNKIITDENKILKEYVDLNQSGDILKEVEFGKSNSLFDIWLLIILDLWLKYIDIYEDNTKIN